MIREPRNLEREGPERQPSEADPSVSANDRRLDVVKRRRESRRERTDDPRALEDQRRVDLQGPPPRLEANPRSRRRADPAGGVDRHVPARRGNNALDDAWRFIEQCAPGQPSLAPRQAPLPNEPGVGARQAVGAAVDRDRGHREYGVALGVPAERRELHEQRCPTGTHRCQQFREVRLIVAVAPPRHVRTARVELDRVHVRFEERVRLDDVVNRLVGDAGEPRGRSRRARERPSGRNRPGVRQPHRVPHRRPMLVPHDRLAGIPPPRSAGERARDDVPEAETAERIEAATCLVEAGGQTDGVCQIDPGERRSESGIGDGAADALPREREPQRGVRDVMGRLRRKGEQRAPHRPVQVHRHLPPGSAQRLLRPLCYAPGPLCYASMSDAIARRLLEVSELHGDFVLSSGKRSSVYFDKFRFLTDPDLLRETARAVARLLPERVTHLAAPEGAATLLVAAVALETNRRIVVVRKKAKAYGTRSLVEGDAPDGAQIALIEDVSTTGTQVLGAATALEDAGCTIALIVLAIDRGGAARLREAGYDVSSVAEVRGSD